MKAPNMITVLVLDVDGVLTDGKLYYGPSGEVLKQFHVHDGLAISVFLKAGIQVAVISGRESEPLTCRLDQLGVQYRFLACKDKPKALKQLCQMLGVSLANVAYVGDDLIDLAAMKMVGFAACPADAVADVQQHSHYIAKKAGGCGAVREICC